MSDHEQQPDLTQRRFLKRLAGTAAGVVGFAAASRVLSPPPAEAVYSNGTAPDGGDFVNTSLWVDGNLTVEGPRPWIDVRAYGAVGNGVTNDTAAVQAAFNAVPVPGGIVFFPPGEYLVTAPITLTDRSIRVLGAGRGVSAISWSGASGGFDFTFTQYFFRLTVESIGLLAKTANSGVALKASWPAFVGGAMSAPHVHDVYIGSYGGYWNKGIELTNATGVKIHDFDIYGGLGLVSSHAIHLLGTSTTSYIGSGLILYTAYGIQVSGVSEGVYLRDIETVANHYGYVIDSAGPGSSIANCHANTDIVGIVINGHGEVALTGNLLYQSVDAAPAYTGIHILSSMFNRIIGNEIATTNPGGVNPRNGIVLQGGDYCTVQGNVIRDMNSGVWVVAGSDNNIVLGNIGFNCGATVTNAGIGNVVVNNI